MTPALLYLLLLFQNPAPGTARGVVVDAQTGEALARVSVQLLGGPYQAVTDERGRFEIGAVAPGGYTLHVSTVGYRLAKREFQLAAGETKEFEVVLSADSFRQTDTVEVRAEAFEPLRSESVSEINLVGAEMKNLASVLADDPLRAVQALPGVASDDDFNATFSLRGAPYSRIGLYLDDVLLHQPFHTVQDQSASGSLTIFNGDMVQDMALISSAFPARYGDRGAGILDVHLREGSRKAVSVRGTASASNAGLMAEGPLARGRGSWMAGIRKSYLQYLIDRTSDDSTLAGGFWDAQGRATLDVAPSHQLSLSLFHGNCAMDRLKRYDRLGINSLAIADFQFELANLGWRWTPRQDFVLTTRGAWMRESSFNQNRDRLELGSGYYGEWIWNTGATWSWHGQDALEAGFSLRRLRHSGLLNQYQFNPFAVRRADEYRGTGVVSGGWAQQGWQLFGGRVRLSAGLRWDGFSPTDASVVTPRASLAVQLLPGTRLQLGWGEYVQFPDIPDLTARYGNPALLPTRSLHYSALIDQRLGARTRFRFEAYQRLDRDLGFRPIAEPRLVGQKVFNPPLDSPVFNSLRGYSRGIELMLQRRSANRFTGWVSYALSYTRYRDGLIGQSFWSDEDQRHTVNAYVSYRIRPTVNLSTKWAYGSGFPVPGFFRKDGTRYFLAERRNEVRLEAYQRADVRVNKAWVFDRWKLTLYGEVVNLFNHKNRRYDSFNGYSASTGVARPGFSSMFPILPSAGIAAEF